MRFFINIINLFCRFAWLLSVAQSLGYTIGLDPNIFSFYHNLIDTFRRNLWDFFFVENQHRMNQDRLSAVYDMNFPINPLILEYL
jgi:hypothetical protein